VSPTPEIVRAKEEEITKAYRACDELIRAFKEGRLERVAGCDMELSLEQQARRADGVARTP
jgi:DNA-directed RNA polymerase III subunit RPC1